VLMPCFLCIASGAQNTGKVHSGHAMMAGGMDRDALRYFLAAYRRGSLSAAARELG
jgi:hypothetical protein